MSKYLSSASPYLLLSLTALFWSGNWVIGRAFVSDSQIPPVALAWWRWAIAVSLITPFALPQIRRHWSTIWQHRKIISLLALLGMGFHNLLTYVGLQFTTATNGVLLNSATPVMIILLGVLFFKRRVPAIQLLGVAISLIGVLAILTKGQPALLATLQFNRGDLIVLASMLLWALYTLTLKWRPAGLPGIALLAVCGVIGLIGMSPVYLWEIAGGKSIQWTWGAAAALLYLGIFPSVLGYIFWNRGVEQVGPSVAGLFMHLMPVFGSLLAWLFLGERLFWFHFAGIILIFAGIYLTTRATHVIPPAAEAVG
ncbi:MAG: DMT family transporter [Burkholderiales bacterium]|nr:DMT family transporter [Burkholderiales bacterium]